MVRAWALGLVGAACLATTPASAQANLEPPPTYQTVDRFGVDLTSGSLMVSSPTISVGDPAHGGLTFTATWDSRVRAWRYSNWGSVKKEVVFKDIYCLALYTVTYMGKSNIFRRDACGLDTFSLFSDGVGTLVANGSGYIYTAPDGAVATYGATAISSIVKPNGEVITYSYSGGNLTSVSNNLGYQLHFQYSGNTLAKVAALNNAVDACGLTAASCTFPATQPSLTFAHPGLEYHVTDNLGRTTRVIYDSNDSTTGYIVGVARPTTASGASITYTHENLAPHAYKEVASASDGTGNWTYAYETYCPPFGNECPQPDITYDLDTTITDPNGHQTTYNIQWRQYPYEHTDLGLTSVFYPQLASVRNHLNQTTLVSESGRGLHGITYPEGNRVAYGRNEHGNITGVTTTPKAGSGLSATQVTVTYPDCAVEPILCRRPSSMTDARGGVTHYTYDAAGNLLTETGPAPTPGAPRPQTRYVWAQRYAWYKRNGAAAITRAASPVWVQVSQSQCLTGATCE